MKIYIPEPSTAGRRLRGLAVSAPLHIAVLGLLVALSRESTLRPPASEAGPVVTYVSSPGQPVAAPGDKALGGELETPDHGVSGRTGTDGLDFNLDKIRARQTSLFPFLTLDLMFLGSVSEAIHHAPRKLVNPFTAAAPTTASAPPLAVTDGALQEIVDRAWSRRERWRTFSEIAKLVEAHDPNDGRVPELLRAYLDQNLLQPFCDASIRDPRFWAMLENAADHAEFIDFVRSFARRHPSSKTTTELLFLIDEMAQGSRDVLLMLLDTHPDEDLQYTRQLDRGAYELASSIRDRYDAWLFDRQIHTSREVKERYDSLRLRLLSTIIETTPGGYRASDARYLAGEIAFNQGNWPEALRYWRGIIPDRRDTYVDAYSHVLEALESPQGLDLRTVGHILKGVYGRWRMYSIDRLRQFGHACDTF